jgi:hypothetical protein
VAKEGDITSMGPGSGFCTVDGRHKFLESDSDTRSTAGCLLCISRVCEIGKRWVLALLPGTDVGPHMVRHSHVVSYHIWRAVG